jgi:hypothetical protein
VTPRHDRKARARERAVNRLGLLKRRSAVGSVLAFAAAFGVAAAHGRTAHHRVVVRRPAAAPAAPVRHARFFDEAGKDYSFANDAAAAAPPPPPVVESNVS